MLRKYKTFVLLVILIYSNYTNAQIVVTNQTANYLVNNVLLAGGVSVSNITFTGSSSAIGEFLNTNPGFQFASGVLLTTGLATNAIGPNNNSEAEYLGGLPGNVDITSISQSPSHDAAVIEFDFVPSSDTISFRYVFASEEYMEYVGTGVNDGFGFFISGPGISGPFSNNSQNLALIPGTNQHVTIDNLNANQNSSFYINNAAGTNIQYDGMTVPLIAKSAVQCGQTYHIKLVIADAGDDSVDSGVFIEAGSFSSPQAITVDVASSVGDTILYEGCNTGKISIVRPLTASSTPMTVQVNLSGTATNGEDVNFIPMTLNLLSGQDSLEVPITTLLDNLDEGFESLSLQFIYTNNCNVQDTITKTIWIHDPIKIDSIIVYSDAHCFGELSAYGNGAAEIYVSNNAGSPTYVLSNLNLTSTQTSSLNSFDSLSVGFYIATVSDNFCFDTDTLEIIDEVKPKPIALFHSSIRSCYSNELSFLNESTDAATVKWYLNSSFVSAEMNPSFAGFIVGCNAVSLSVRSEAGCSDSLTIPCAVEIYPSPIAKIKSSSHEYIIGTESLFVLENSSIGSVSCIWMLADSIIHLGCDEFITQDLQTIGDFTYKIIVKNEFGCIDSSFVIITIKDLLTYYVPNTFTPNGDELNNTFLPIFSSGFILESYHFTVYNRWGELIFESYDPKVGWDGSYGNQLAKSDIYTWRINFRDEQKNQIHELNGFINLIK